MTRSRQLGKCSYRVARIANLSRMLRSVLSPRKRLSRVDAAWLHMDDPTNWMVVNTAIFLKPPVTRDALESLLHERLLVPNVFERFRQKVIDSGSTAWWVDTEVDLSHHVIESTLPSPGDDEGLRAHIGAIACRPISHERPLWEFHLIRGYASGEIVLVPRFHHCMADGFALVRALFALAGESDETFSVAPKPPTQSSRLEILRYALGRARAFSRLALLRKDRETFLKRSLGMKKVVAWSNPIDLDRLRQVANRSGSTLNDVALSLVAGVLGESLSEHGERTSDLSTRAMVPVNLRSPSERFTMGNRFGLVVVDLPTGDTNGGRRVLRLKQQMDELKKTPEAFVGLEILSGLGAVPTGVERLGVDFFAAKTSLVLSNVPGPRTPIFLMKQEVTRLLFWVPQAGRMGLGVSLMSYAGTMTFGLMADANVLPRPQDVVPRFEQILVALESTANLG